MIIFYDTAISSKYSLPAVNRRIYITSEFHDDSIINTVSLYVRC
ncbi:hypothetical protein HMPREF0080_00432 [Anaeroglobus geminatus F0357]|uniref:Uncharacterized protein n=1 Tax=Anaeroglobus geminatus F0357 TaxID=861450 RepID=G9YFM0_9FIRM|nr:hypothetical protein HMPREF0080_00432 [Anaeroglobus geminatus F0357]